MALFTDPNVITLDDLLQFESSLVQVSTTHAIDVETKITLAVNAISERVMLWLLNSRASDPQFIQRRFLGLSTVVVTSTLYRWLCFDALSRFFAEAYNVQLNTRFQGKWTEYQQEAQAASDMVFMSGIGIVYKPLARPGMPIVNVTAGNSLAESLFIQTTWVDCMGNESAASLVGGQLLGNFSGLTVVPVPANGMIPTAATGWNVYASTTNSSLALQNNSSLPLTATWQLPNEPLLPGRVPGSGQLPDFYIALTRRIQRG
jgi:hypothetical protein